MKKIFLAISAFIFLTAGIENALAQFIDMKPGDAVVMKEKGKTITDGKLRIACYPKTPGEIKYAVYDMKGKEIISGSQFMSSPLYLEILLGDLSALGDSAEMKNGSGVLTVILNGSGYDNKILKAPVSR